MSARTVGLDLAKQVFQVHGVDDAGRPVLKKRLRRAEVRSFFAGLAPCVVGIVARQGIAGLDSLIASVETEADIPSLARRALDLLVKELTSMKEQIKAVENEILN